MALAAAPAGAVRVTVALAAEGAGLAAAVVGAPVEVEEAAVDGDAGSAVVDADSAVGADTAIGVSSIGVSDRSCVARAAPPAGGTSS